MFLSGLGFPENIWGLHPPYLEVLWGFIFLFFFFSEEENKSKQLDGLN